MGMQDHVDTVAVPVPQRHRAAPFLGAGEGEPGRLGSLPVEEQIGRGASYDL